MRQVVGIAGARPTSRARARSPASGNNSSSARQSQAAAYGFQSPVASRGSGSIGTAGSSGVASAARTSSPALKSDLSAGGSFSAVPGRGGTRGVPGQAGPAAPESRASRSSRLSVVVRKRPMNRREAQAQQQDVVVCRNSAVIVREPKLKVDLTRYVEEHSFLFDQSFDETVSNEQLYRSCVRPVIDAVFQRAKCTCFAYGQTGSGKTFTMMGPNKKQCEGIPEKDRTPGIFLLAAQDIFRSLANKEHSHLGVYIAFYEIYCGKLFDLLNNRQILHARENAKSNVVIVGLQEHPVENVQELMEVIEFGLNSRTTGVTGANVDSSRSHAILQISLKDNRGKEDGRRMGSEHGKISFIDLAGSERGADTLDTDRQTRMDGAEINKSLLALKECIRALDQQLDHTPFRGSKLTQVLKDSFVGSNCRTVMIANVSPCGCAVEHSLNTLRYAYRVKELRSGSKPSVIGSQEIGVLADYAQPLGAQGELVIDEDSSADEDSGGGVETPPSVQQQLRVANLSAAAQTFASPRGAPDVACYSGKPREEEEVHGQPPRYTLAGGAAASGPGPCGGAAGSGLAALASTGLAVGGPEVALASDTSVEALQGIAATGLGVPGAVGTVARGGVVVQSLQLEPAAEPAPEVALEPVGAGCSQAALDELARQHDRLIGTILAEEEELITAHRQHIDMMVELIKEEMVHLNNVDRPGSDVDAYVEGLDRILRLKAQYTGDIRQRVDLFKEHLQQEDTLSRKFQSLASASS
mmetsp:Transcript_21112/g.66721  ORF Transcript_21112/g.66721 Transcript_21112/m.66721 type:complete len:754 (-) Transcript_21112:168-2429(-)